MNGLKILLSVQSKSFAYNACNNLLSSGAIVHVSTVYVDFTTPEFRDYDFLVIIPSGTTTDFAKTSVVISEAQQSTLRSWSESMGGGFEGAYSLIYHIGGTFKAQSVYGYRESKCSILAKLNPELIDDFIKYVGHTLISKESTFDILLEDERKPESVDIVSHTPKDMWCEDGFNKDIASCFRGKESKATPMLATSLLVNG